jgi:hypothetical protein
MVEIETLISKMNMVPFEERRSFIKQIINDILNSEDPSFFLNMELIEILAEFLDTEKPGMCMAALSYLYSFSFDNPELAEILESIVT